MAFVRDLRPWPAGASLLRSPPVVLALAAVTASYAIGPSVIDPARIRLLLTAAAGWLLVGMGFAAPQALLGMLVIWLTGMGLARRLVSALSPMGPLDPLLLVAPLALAVLTLVAVRRGAFREPTRLSRGVLVLSVLALVGALNPLQGSALAGVAGLLFLLVPMLAFWVGRSLCDDRSFRRALALVALLAPLTALYGLAQVFRGFPSWDLAWIRESGYTALNVGPVIRPFGTFTSAAEYAFYLGVALVIWLAYGLRPVRLPLTAAIVALLGVATFYEASRGIVVLLLATAGLMAAARRRMPFVAGALVALTFAALLVRMLPQWVPANLQGDPTSALVAHQVKGLAAPLDPRRSTLPGHIRLMGVGLGTALSHPLGLGTGAASMAGSKFGGVVLGTEVDPSNVAVALGIPGLVAYLVVVITGFRRAYALASRRVDPLGVAALGVLSVTFLQWLNGGQYAVAFLPWLALGWVDATYRRLVLQESCGDLNSPVDPDLQAAVR